MTDTPTCKTCHHASMVVAIGCRGICWERMTEYEAYPDRPACELYRVAEYGGQLREIAADALKTITELKVILELPPEAGNSELILAVMRRL